MRKVCCKRAGTAFTPTAGCTTAPASLRLRMRFAPYSPHSETRQKAMGLYDEVVCEYPLPDGYDATGIVFQTKDLTNELERWTITVDGDLVDAQGRRAIFRIHPSTSFMCPFTGAVRLIYSNDLAGGGGRVCTVDNAPPQIWRYTILFQDGRVIGAEGGSTLREGLLHVPREEFWKQVEGQPTWRPPTGDDLPNYSDFDEMEDAE